MRGSHDKNASRHYASLAKNEEILDVKENPAFNTPAKMAFFLYAIGLGALVIGFASMFIHKASWERDVLWLIAAPVLMFGPIFAAIVWSTRRYFRNKELRKASK